MTIRRGIANVVLPVALAFTAALPAAHASDDPPGGPPESFDSTPRPIEPRYRVHADGSATVRICFNWACAMRQEVTFTAAEMAEVGRQMALCPGDGLEDRLQRVRIGVWQMEVLAQERQPLLANDTPVNDRDRGIDGRMDCVDNATNTTTYLSVLHELDMLAGWTVDEPRVRDPLSFDVHWTATVSDERSRRTWAVDAWFYGNGTLPFVMPIGDWKAARKGWEPPLARINPYPRYAAALCPRMASADEPDPLPRSTVSRLAEHPSE